MGNDHLKDVGRFIVRKRSEREGMTQADCALKCGIGRSALSDIENGNRLPNGKELLDLSRILKTSPNEILSAGEDVSNFKREALEQETSDMMVSLARAFLVFSRLSRDNKELIQKVMLSMAFGDLTPKEQADFFNTYEKMPEYIADLKVMVEAFGELGMKSTHPETGEPLLSRNLIETLEDSVRSFYNGGDFGALFGICVSIAPAAFSSMPELIKRLK